MRVCVTGGSGSFGRAFITAARHDPTIERLVCLSRDEVKQGEVAEQFAGYAALRTFVGDVRDRDRLEHAFYGCDTVIHAAALKRVTESAYSPNEMIETNIYGTVNVVQAALAMGVKRVLLLSSDKAVAPANLYGATKMVAEGYCVQANAYTAPRGTLVACTRYGNVVGSRGSVVEVFRRAVAAERPLPLTDREMTRFWLTLEQAVMFVRGAVRHLTGGEIFVPSLAAVRLRDVAAAVAPSGYPVDVIGRRPGGEKLHERLLGQEEEARTRRHPEWIDTLVITPSFHPWVEKPAWETWPYSTVAWYTSDRGPFLAVETIRAMLP